MIPNNSLQCSERKFPPQRCFFQQQMGADVADVEKGFKLETSIRTLQLRKSLKRGAGMKVGVRAHGGTPQEHLPLSQLSRAHVGSQKLKQQAQGIHGSAPGPLFMLWMLAWSVCGTPNCGSGCVSDSFASSWDSFLPVGLPCPASV